MIDMKKICVYSQGMTVESRAFADGVMPKKCTGFGEDVSPELTINNMPEGTVSLAVILDDLDVPFQDEYTHWIIWNIPPVNVIPERLPKGKSISSPISAVQGKAWGRHVYRGPKQPFFSRKKHRYLFKVYALDCMLDISSDSKKTQLISAMENHILEKAELLGNYDPR